MATTAHTSTRSTYRRHALPLVQLILTLGGIAVAGYLSWVHFVGVAPVCGGLGQCETVQASEYATLLGIPVAYLGLATYLVVLALLTLRGRSNGSVQELALLLQFAVLLVGVVFSGWLTYVELWVIHAICPWCLTSAIVMVGLFVLTGRDVRRATRVTAKFTNTSG